MITRNMALPIGAKIMLGWTVTFTLIFGVMLCLDDPVRFSAPIYDPIKSHSSINVLGLIALAMAGFVLVSWVESRRRLLAGALYLCGIFNMFWALFLLQATWHLPTSSGILSLLFFGNCVLCVAVAQTVLSRYSNAIDESELVRARSMVAQAESEGYEP